MSDMESTLKKILAQQTEQSKRMAEMQDTIANLTKINAEIREDISAIKSGKIRTKFKYINKQEGGIATETWTTRPGETEDKEVEDIIQARMSAGTWPLKRNFCKSFSKEVDLVKIRFHNSDTHTHKPVRIPKVERSDGSYGSGNKEGRLICRLCSGGQINRNTSWMCSTCCVPLCVDYQGSPDRSCHYRWHSCDDLLKQHELMNTELKNKREAKKRSGGSVAGLDVPPKIPKVDAAILAAASAASPAVNDPVNNLTV